MGHFAPGVARPKATLPSEEAERRERVRGAIGVEANARLTGMTAVALLVLLAAEGLTILRIWPLLGVHVFIGMLLVPPVLLKIGTTTYRFLRYYSGHPAYRRKGPPPGLLRLLGPVIVVLSIVMLGTGIELLFAGPSLRPSMLFLHQASFVMWFFAMTVHVLGHIVETTNLAPRDFYARTRRQVRGAGLRQWTLAAALAVGFLLGSLLFTRATTYRNTVNPPHPTAALGAKAP